MDQKTKNIKYALPILLLMIGGFFTFLAVSMSTDAGFTFRVFTAGPALVLLGIATLVAPIDVPEEQAAIDLIAIIKQAPKWKIAIWAVAFLAGILFKDAFLSLF